MSTQTTTITAPGSTTYTAPATLLNGAVVATVYGAPGGIFSGGVLAKSGRVAGTVTVAPSGALTCVVGDVITFGTSHGQHIGGGGSTGSIGVGAHGGGSSAVLAGATVLLEAGGGGGQGYNGATGGTGGLHPTGGNASSAGTTKGGGGGGGGHQGVGSAGGTAGTGAGGAAPGGGGQTGGTPGGGGGAGGTSFAAASGVSSVSYADGVGSGAASITVVATVADPPLAPTLTAPAPGAYLDSNAAGVPFTWTYQPAVDSGTQTGYALRVLISGSYQYWNATSVAFQGSIVWNTTTNHFVAVPAGLLPDGVSYNWSVATQESHYSLQGPFASDSVFTASAMPTVAVTAPAGSIATATPTVTWTEVLGGGLTQTSFRVVVYTLAVTLAGGFSPGVTTPTVDSGVVSSAALSWAVPTALAQGNWVVYVQVVETGAVASNWSSSAFAIAYSGPAAPTLTATAGNDPATGAPTVTLLAQGNDTGGSGFVGISLMSITSSDDGGTTWTPVRNATNVPVPAVGQQVTVVDYEARFGIPRLYSAVVSANITTPTVATVVSSPGTATAVDSSPNFWLSDPNDPTAALALHRLGSVGVMSTLNSPISFQLTSTESLGVFYAFGRPNAIVQRGTIQAPTFTLNFLLEGAAEAGMFQSLVNRQATLLVRSDMGDAWYVVLGPDVPASTLRAVDRIVNPYTVVSVMCTVVDRP